MIKKLKKLCKRKKYLYCICKNKKYKNFDVGEYTCGKSVATEEKRIFFIEKFKKISDKGTIHLKDRLKIDNNIWLRDSVFILGNEAIVRMRAVVTKDIKLYEMIVGNLVKHIRFRDKQIENIWNYK